MSEDRADKLKELQLAGEVNMINFERHNEEIEFQKLLRRKIETGSVDTRHLKKFLADVLKMSNDEIIDECYLILNKKSKLSSSSRQFCVALGSKIWKHKIDQYKENSNVQNL